MTKNKFEGELKFINPRYLVNERQNERIESFFIGLGAVFNDLKGLLFFEKMLMEYYEVPEEDETSPHAGNYFGIEVQIQKLITSSVFEFFAFLKANNDVFSMSEFIEILNELPRDEQVIWNNFIEAANERYSETTVLFNTMSKIRHNVGFHYDQKGKVLRNAYISFFYGKNIDNRHVYAYYSIGKNLELSRFYFSDAVIQESMYIASGGKMKEINKNDESFKIYQQQVMETVKVMCSIILQLMKEYIRSRRNSHRT